MCQVQAAQVNTVHSTSSLVWVGWMRRWLDSREHVGAAAGHA